MIQGEHGELPYPSRNLELNMAPPMEWKLGSGTCKMLTLTLIAGRCCRVPRPLPEVDPAPPTRAVPLDAGPRSGS